MPPAEQSSGHGGVGGGHLFATALLANLQPLGGVRMSQEPSLGGRASQGTLRLRLHVARIRRIQLPLFALLLTDSDGGSADRTVPLNLLFFSPLLSLSADI